MMFTFMVMFAGFVLVFAAFVTVYRIIFSVSILDRVIAFDVLVSIFMAGVVLDMAYRRDFDNIMLLVILALVGFIGSVTVSRFVMRGE